MQSSIHRFLLPVVIISIVNADRRKELQVKKDIKIKPYNAKQTAVFNTLIDVIGETTEDTPGNWLKHGDTCDPDVHKDRLSNKYPLETFRDQNITKNLCSIFEDMACDSVEKICKCWTAGGIGRMEWAPEFKNERKPAGRCVMTSRERCGVLDLPARLLPHVDFPLLRKFHCDKDNDYRCDTDLDGVQRCTNEEDEEEDEASIHVNTNVKQSPIFYISLSYLIWIYGLKT